MMRIGGQGRLGRPTFYEFFAGGGMARAGLGPRWRCLFANDIDERKGLVYQLNYPAPDVLRIGDVGGIAAADLPRRADLVWGSFPCQDLSLAGGGGGLNGERSGAFHPFWQLIRDLIALGRAPAIVAVENVVGTLTSSRGRDFAAICQAFADAGYRHGALVIDAALFVAQSRPRLFVIGVRNDVAIDPALHSSGPAAPFHTAALRRACDRMGAGAREQMVWWTPPTPPPRGAIFADLIEEDPASVRWHSDAERDSLLAKLSPINRAKLEAAGRAGRRMVGGLYRRTRIDERGARIQRAELRFDDLAGCLRTPAGGSSRQIIIVVDGETVRTRLISARETARLMGLPDDYRLPTSYSEAYRLTGDGVVVPVVRHLAQHIFEPLIAAGEPARAAA